MIPDDEPTTFWREKELKSVHRIKEWEKFIHKMYFDQLYFWQGGLLVRPYKFEPLEIYVEESEWYGEYGEVEYGGGYTKTAKSLTVPNSGKLFNIVDDFKPIRRNSMKFDYYSIPELKLWADKY